MRSARAARLPVVVSVLLLPDEPMVLPLLLGVSDEPLLAAGALDDPALLLGVDDELEPLAPIEEPLLLGDEAVPDDGDEPLAPIDVPLLAGVDELEELVDGCELLVSLLLDPEVAGALLEPDAPMELVDGLLVPVAGPPVLPGALLPPAAEPPLVPAAVPPEAALPELWARARPPNARAAAAARVVRVVLVALMLNSLIDMLGNAPAWRAG
ncbi:hypothetical protein PE066_16050 [Ramlibacter tataouinensis]|uniref:hypothetical protein n=1 Tax=Ramlibacter tataouinensis TaxID=94132 RepID=UPI0022F3F21F|nr:hypothetical protein [Ramlibacter tataouinensis]WBY00964.1 hypothetical protein PE066_16050 [Ramlibacter tataouinensis]